jgi:hypothetical protein
MKNSTAILGVERKDLLSTLWVFVLVNMAYADILSLMDPASVIRQKMAGAPLPAGGLIAGAILMETGIAMILLSRILPYRWNRWTNIFFAAVNIFAVVTGGSGVYYYIFAAIESISLILIIVIAARWPKPQEASSGAR